VPTYEDAGVSGVKGRDVRASDDRERVMAGLARARAEGKQLGRRSVEQSDGAKVKAALRLRSRGIGIRRMAREVGLGVGTVMRLVGNENAALS
jgi:DNA invertase Pin-like site-specific DNA recombinase